MPFTHKGKPRGGKVKTYKLKRAKKMLQKVHSKQKKSNLDTFALTCKSSGIITPVQGVTVANYIYSTVPLMSSTLNVGVTQNAEFALYRNMYDQVRINSVLVRVTPKANVLDAINNNLENVNLSGDGQIHTIIDRDGSPTANTQIFSRSPSYKKYSVLKPFTRKYSIKWPPGVWLDAQNIYEDTSLLKQVGALGGIYIYAENIVEDNLEVFNEPFADIQIWYNVVFRGKTQGTLSYDFETGAVSVLPLDVLPQLTPTPFNNVRGTISDTLAEQGDDDGDKKVVDVPITDSFKADDD